MPLTPLNEPGEIDAFGVRFSMEDRGKLVRCHVFRAAVEFIEERPARTNDELIARFQANRRVFERMASDLYDAGHRTPWIGVFGLTA
jgi:hypothetical protein